MLPLSDVQLALYAAIGAAVSVPVLDGAGPDQEYPFVTIGEFTAEPDDALRDAGAAIEAMVHIWSRYPGMREIQTLMELISLALHRQTLTLAGGAQWVESSVDYSATLRDPDGITRHGVMRIRILTFQPAAAIAG